MSENNNQVKEKLERNFDLIFDEILRQFNIQFQTSNNLDSKSQFMMGLIGVIIGYILTQKEFLEILRCGKYVPIILYIAGLILLLVAGILVFLSYRVRTFKMGAEIEKLINQYRENANLDFKKIIGKGIYNSFVDNSKILEDKSLKIKWGWIFLWVGLVLLVFSTWLNL